AAGAAALRREGGEDRKGEPRPRSTFPLRRLAAAAWLPGSSTPEGARRHRVKIPGAQRHTARNGSAPEAGRERSPRASRSESVQTGNVQGHAGIGLRLEWNPDFLKPHASRLKPMLWVDSRGTLAALGRDRR